MQVKYTTPINVTFEKKFMHYQWVKPYSLLKCKLSELRLINNTSN